MPANNELIRPGLPSSAVNVVAVVSPCTSCKNHRTEYTEEGYLSCPRKIWELRNKTKAIANAVPNYLVATGTSHGSYVNPVYSEDNQMILILIWTANLIDNCGLYQHATETLVTPNILDPNFDSTYIKCNPLPSLMMETEASYYQEGAYKEMETLINFGIQPFQIPTSDEPMLVGGFAKRIDLAFQVSFKTHDEDVIISGM